MKLRIATCLLFSFCAAQASAQQLLRSVKGLTGDRFGAAVLDIGDDNFDGYDDFLVGAPGSNGGRGSVHCVSGKHLATGNDPVVLWIVSPAINAGAAFGTSLVKIGNITGDAASDFIVGAPNFVVTGGFTTRGAIFLIDGTTHAVAAHIYGLPETHFGQSLVSVGDQTGDFKADVGVSAPNVSTSANNSEVHMVPTSAFGFASNLANIAHPSHSAGWHQYGAALASGFDYDGDGKFDLAISIPNYGFTSPNSGYVEVRKANTFGIIQAYTTNHSYERFGTAIDARHDYNSDGVIDLVVGAPGWSAANLADGRVVVVNGRKFCDPNLPEPLELFSLDSGFASIQHNFVLGTSVRACGDLDNDGVPDILAGAPGSATSGFPSQNVGMAVVFSGRTGTRMGSLNGTGTDRLGDAVAGGVEDLTGDGFLDFLVAGPLSDAGGTDSGVVKAFKLFPASPLAYCTAKTNSLGCTPSMSWSGAPSASSATPFNVTCSNQISQKSGLLFYSHAPAAAAFQGGTLCVSTPLKRTGPLNSGGSASGADCTGSFSFDMNARIQSGVDPALVAGAQLFCQYWSRDPASPSTTSLSNALRVLISP